MSVCGLHGAARDNPVGIAEEVYPGVVKAGSYPSWIRPSSTIVAGIAFQRWQRSIANPIGVAKNRCARARWQLRASGFRAGKPVTSK